MSSNKEKTSNNDVKDIENKMNQLSTEGEAEENKELTVAEGFQVNILDLVNLCINIVSNIIKAGVEPPCSVDILRLAHDYIKARNPDQIVTNFIDKSHEAWKDFDKKEEKLLFDNIHALFPGIPQSQVTKVTEIFNVKDKKGELVITDKDKAAIWDFVEGFIGLSIYYIHQNREPILSENGKIKYTKVFYKQIKVSEYAAKFKIDLTVP